MNKSFSLSLFFLVIFFAAIFSSCHNKGIKKYSDSKTLFRLLEPKECGIYFSNKLTESDTDNAIFYEYYYNGSGLAVGDLDNDGLSDIVFGANMTECRIYLNKGKLKFSDITRQSGLNTSGKWITGVSLVDINNDGWLDIYLCAAGNIDYDYTNLLYVSNGEGENLSFKECAAAVGLDDRGYSTQAVFFDYDCDGDLDMYLVTASMTIPNKNALRQRKNDGSMPNTDRLYRNEGINPKTNLPLFRNVSREAGISWDGFGLGVSVCDINRDGWPDIYVGNDYISNDLLYINQKNGTFREMVQEYTKHVTLSTMGLDIADCNNDGLVDIITLDMQPENYYRKRTMALNMRDYKRYLSELNAGYSPQYIRNMIHLNNGNIDGRITLSDIGQLAGIFETDWSWAPILADFDNDGLKDLIIGNGIQHDVTNMDVSELWMKTIRANRDIEFTVLYKLLKAEMDKLGHIKKPNMIFKNSGNLIFEKKSVEWGLERPSYSTGTVFADLDNDGDLDLVMNNINDPAFVYENRLLSTDSVESGRHFISLTLKGDSKNTGGIGTKITIYHDGRLQYYEHFPVRGFQSMVDPKIHFGLGASASVDSIIICWPDEKIQKLRNVQSDQFIEVRYRDANTDKIFENRKAKERLFIPVSAANGIKYVHKERQFIDFDIQPLVPHQYSKEGPGIAVGDINSDGLDDFFVGGSTSYS
jgi:YD repeat-containing protein